MSKTKNKKPTEDIKAKNRVKVIIGIVAVFLIISLSVVSFIISKNISANLVKEKQETEQYQNWLSENCECLARERYYCLGDGFELVNNEYCYNKEKGLVSGKVLGCSLYSCNGQNVTWNNQNEKWEPKING